jgi:hypothetical protein
MRNSARMLNAGFDSRVMLGIFPLLSRGLRTLFSPTNLRKEDFFSRNPEREGPNSTIAPVFALQCLSSYKSPSDSLQSPLVSLKADCIFRDFAICHIIHKSSELKPIAAKGVNTPQQY